jgi:hypothetical protein
MVVRKGRNTEERCELSDCPPIVAKPIGEIRAIHLGDRYYRKIARDRDHLYFTDDLKIPISRRISIIFPDNRHNVLIVGKVWRD